MDENGCRESVDCIATRHELDGPEIEIRFGGGGEILRTT